MSTSIPSLYVKLPKPSYGQSAREKVALGLNWLFSEIFLSVEIILQMLSLPFKTPYDFFKNKILCWPVFKFSKPFYFIPFVVSGIVNLLVGQPLRYLAEVVGHARGLVNSVISLINPKISKLLCFEKMLKHAVALAPVALMLTVYFAPIFQPYLYKIPFEIAKWAIELNIPFQFFNAFVTGVTAAALAVSLSTLHVVNHAYNWVTSKVEERCLPLTTYTHQPDAPLNSPAYRSTGKLSMLLKTDHPQGPSAGVSQAVMPQVPAQTIDLKALESTDPSQKEKVTSRADAYAQYAKNRPIILNKDPGIESIYPKIEEPVTPVSPKRSA